ncbi:hypothetical protein [Jiangella gansuensis]|uniref:hypothetical protein n=1 Tax=Jiangella gansuensis TaxID=281473 RepID=UPI00047D07D3|nr:hypothetical protein [Jiangella gansuensis]
MTDAKLKELFEQALAGEPRGQIPVDDDIARGRALRSRRRRTRIGGGVAVLAVVGAGVVVAPVLVPDGDGAPAASDPSNQVWPYDTPASVPARDDAFELHGLGPQSGAGLSESTRSHASTIFAEVSPEGVVSMPGSQLDLWTAVSSALPADLALASGPVVREQPGSGPGLLFSAVRGGTTFTVDIRLQEARPDLPEFQPCREPAEVPDGVATWAPCEQGYDDDSRWRIVGQAGDDTGVAVAEGGSVAAMVEWSSTIHDVGTATDTVGDFAETLTFEEANAVVEAAWSAGSEYDVGELVTGWDMELARDTWPQIEEAFETGLGLGELTRTSFDDGDPSTIVARYRTADDVEVDLVVWQDDRFYENLCTADASGACESWFGSETYFQELDDADVALAAGGFAGLGSYFVRIGAGAPVDTDRDVGAALKNAIPRRGVTATPASNTD